MITHARVHRGVKLVSIDTTASDMLLRCETAYIPTDCVHLAIRLPYSAQVVSGRFQSLNQADEMTKGPRTAEQATPWHELPRDRKEVFYRITPNWP